MQQLRLSSKKMDELCKELLNFFYNYDKNIQKCI